MVETSQEHRRDRFEAAKAEKLDRFRTFFSGFSINGVSINEGLSLEAGFYSPDRLFLSRFSKKRYGN